MYLISNILLGFLLPMILGVEDYGYYKIYTLYVGYCGLLNFGFPDGIILRYGGCEYEKLDRPLFRAYTCFFLLLEGIMTLLVLCGSLFLQKEYGIIIGFVGLNLAWYNMTLYYQYLSQATSRFREFSLRKALQALGIILSLVVLLLVKKCFALGRISYLVMIIVTQGISFALLMWYVYTYRDITFGQRARFRDVKHEIKQVFQKGIVLTISYEVAQLILLMDRQFVSVLYDVEVYAKYAFAYNILSCVTALITAVSTVMFPMLKRIKQEEALRKFEGTLVMVVCLVGLSMVGIYPVEWIINRLLPEYIEAMSYVRIIFPTLVFTSGITIVGATYYKVLDRIKNYLYISLGVVIVAFLCNCIAVCGWNTPAAVSVASVATTVIWFIAAIGYLGQKYKVKWKRSLVYGIFLTVAFYWTSFITCDVWVKVILYLVLYLIASVLVFGRVLKRVMSHRMKK